MFANLNSYYSRIDEEIEDDILYEKPKYETNIFTK